jgi:hypothetical protein
VHELVPINTDRINARFNYEIIGISYQEGHQYHSSEYRYREGSTSFPFPEAYQYRSYMHPQLPKNTTDRCQKTVPISFPSAIFLQEELGKQLGKGASI